MIIKPEDFLNPDSITLDDCFETLNHLRETDDVDYELTTETVGRSYRVMIGNEREDYGVGAWSWKSERHALIRTIAVYYVKYNRMEDNGILSALNEPLERPADFRFPKRE